jgi:hypothetical protein
MSASLRSTFSTRKTFANACGKLEAAAVAEVAVAAVAEVAAVLGLAAEAAAAAVAAASGSVAARLAWAAPLEEAAAPPGEHAACAETTKHNELDSFICLAGEAFQSRVPIYGKDKNKPDRVAGGLVSAQTCLTSRTTMAACSTNSPIPLESDGGAFRAWLVYDRRDGVRGVHVGVIDGDSAPYIVIRQQMF